MSKKRGRSLEERQAHLVSFGKASHVTQSGMAALLKAIEEDGIPESHSRGTQYRARKAFCRMSTPYGPLLTQESLILDDGGEFSVGFTNPFASFHAQCEKSQHYSRIVKDALEQYPCSPSSPWTVVLYQDGVDPTDTLAKHHSRKISVYYYSFLQFGMRALCHEEVWGTMCIAREQKAKELPGGLAFLTSRVCEQFYKDDRDIRRTGLKATLHCGERVHIFASIGCLLADNLAYKEMLECKGPSGMKFCFLCLNATHHKPPGGGQPAHERIPYCVPLFETNFDRFVKQTDESLRETVRRLTASHGVLSRLEFEKKEMDFGWNYCPSSIVLNDRMGINIVSSTMLDWAHIYVCDGIGSDEVGECMSAYRSARDPQTSYREIGEYVAQWEFPMKRSVAHLFTENKAAANYRKKGFTSTASEMLTLVPVLLRYFEHVVLPRGRLLGHARSMIAVLRVIVLLQAIRSCCVTPEVLAAAIVTHLIAYSDAYGANAMRPKHHYALHLPDMLRRFGLLLTTLTHERKHRLVKKYTRSRCNLKAFERSTLEDITAHQHWDLSMPFFNSFSTAKPHARMMIGLRELFPGVPDKLLTVHRDLKINNGTASCKDVVSYELDGAIEFGQIVISVGVASGDAAGLHVCVTKWTNLRVTDDKSLRIFRVKQRHVKIWASQLSTVHTFCMADDGETCSVYMPYEVR